MTPVTMTGATWHQVPHPGDRLDRRPFVLELPNSVPSIPVFIDLDRDGGLVVDDPAIVQGIVLDLLAVLPAGRVHVDAVDPVGLGKSLDFLYGLGDTGTRVFGDKIRTTAQDAATLLVELETHITFVTQKYLQGQYASLTEYNLQPGRSLSPIDWYCSTTTRRASPGTAGVGMTKAC